MSDVPQGPGWWQAGDGRWYPPEAFEQHAAGQQAAAGGGAVGAAGSAAAPPGWYPDASGQQRWWDGTRWTENTAGPATAGAAGPGDRNMAMLAHLLGIFTGFLGPLVIYLVNGRKDPFVRHHSSEALNFQITYLIAVIASVVLILVLIGLVLLPVIAIGALVLEIMGTINASRGQWWRYPINIRMVPGADGR